MSTMSDNWWTIVWYLSVSWPCETRMKHPSGCLKGDKFSMEIPSCWLHRALQQTVCRIKWTSWKEIGVLVVLFMILSSLATYEMYLCSGHLSADSSVILNWCSRPLSLYFPYLCCLSTFFLQNDFSASTWVEASWWRTIQSHHTQE